MDARSQSLLILEETRGQESAKKTGAKKTGQGSIEPALTAGCGNHDVAACCGNIVVHPAEWFSTASIAAWEGGLQTLFRGDQDYVAFERVMGEAFGRVTIWILARRVAAQR